MSKKGSHNLFCIVFVSVFCLLFYAGVVFQNQNVMGAGLLCLFVYIVFYSIRDLNAHITLLVFLIAFFTFLMGRLLLPLFYDVSNLLFDIGGEVFSLKTLTHMFICLFLSLLFVLIGYKCYFSEKKLDIVQLSSTSVSNNVKKYSKCLMYFAYPFALIQVLEKVYLVIKNGYVALYIDFASSLPYIFILIAGWFSITFYIYLATLPSKKEARVPIILFLSIATISIGTGQRGSFVLGYLFVIMYFFLRNKLESGNSPWIGRKGIIRLLVAAPVLVIFLFLMVYIRSDRDSNFSSNLLISFFYQQGVSAEVIGYGFDYEKDFPKGKIYLIGDVKDYLKHNIFARYLFGTNKTEPQTVEHALEDNSFDSALTYFVKPYLYLEGGGLGGCYIAEAYKDLGYFGVCLVNFIYGLLLARIPLWCRKNIWISSIGLGMFSQIIFAPRAHFIKPFFIFMSVNVLLVYFYLYQISRLKVKKANNSI